MQRVSATSTPPAVGVYRHFKGRRYRVLGTAQHSEKLETLVVYQALYGDHGWWVRSTSMFNATVELDGKTVPRFALEHPDAHPAADRRRERLINATSSGTETLEPEPQPQPDRAG